jgi:hypothetical protein
MAGIGIASERLLELCAKARVEVNRRRASTQTFGGLDAESVPMLPEQAE